MNIFKHQHGMAILGIALLLGACDRSGDSGDGTSPAPPADTTSPTVSSVTPADTVTDVTVGTVISVIFSEAMDCATVTASSFTLSAGATVAGSITCSGSSATFTPDAALAYSTNYAVALTTVASDNAGNALASPFSSSFTTVAAPDTTPPTVSSTTPASGATDVAVNTSVTAAFSEAVDCTTLTAATFTLNGGAVAGNVTCGGNTATFTPSADLAASTTYTATITTGATDTAGNALAADYSWSFTTAAAPAVAARVIFGSAGSPSDLFVINDDGTGRVTLAGTPDDDVFMGMSPGGRVIYRRIPVVGGSYDIYSVLPDGSGTVALASSADHEVVMGITPGGRVVYKRQPTAGGQTDLYSVNDDGTGKATLADSTDSEGYALPVTLPNTGLTQGITASGKVVYLRTPVGGGAGDIYIVNADGTGPLTLAGTADDERFPYNTAAGWVAYQRGAYPSGPYYTVMVNEDGTGTAALPTTTGGVVASEAGRVVTRGFPDIATVCFYSLNPDGSNQLQLVCGPSDNTNLLTFKAATGGRVIYARRLGGDLYSISVTGGTPATLAASGENAVSFFGGITATGRVVYGGRLVSGGQADLYSVNVDGTDKVTLADSTDEETYRGSLPDGRVIYERTRVGDCRDIYVVNADGSGALSLDASADCKLFAGLSPSGRVLYLRNVGGSMHLYSVNPDGTGTVVLNAGGSVYYTSF